MNIFCECSHNKTRHRMSYGEPGSGACFDCHCSGMRVSRFELHLGERRILAAIAETKKIGKEVLRRQLTDDNDPARIALDRIAFNLQTARFVEFSFRDGWTFLSATVAGREYLKETPPRV